MFLLRMSAQLFFIFCRTMVMAFYLPRGQVPRQGKPGGASVGGEGARESEIEKAGGPGRASRRSERGAGIAGSRLQGAGSLEPWATPPGAPNKHNGQPLGEPGGLARGDSSTTGGTATRPNPQPRLVTRPAGPGHKNTPKWGIKPPLKPPRVVLCPLLWGIKPPLLGDKTTLLGGYNHPLWGIKPPPLLKPPPSG